MSRALFLLPLFAGAAPLAAQHSEVPEPPEFQRSSERFADAASCRTHLVRLVGEARGAGFDAAEGPYDLAVGDVRSHTVRAEGHGHRIAEYRCAAAELSERSWSRSMSGEVEEEFTIESVARRAEWLKQSGRQKN